MQEHIRRAHPEHYISKLPATEESFLLMINTPPSERVQNQQQSSPSGAQGQVGTPNSQGSSPPMIYLCRLFFSFSPMSLVGAVGFRRSIEPFACNSCIAPK